MRRAGGIVAAFALIASLFVVLKRSPDPTTVPVARDVDLHRIRCRDTPPDARLIFLGDSIVGRWEYHPSAWERLARFKPANHGCGGDRVEHVIWRVQNGALDGVRPDWIVIQAGTNNVGGGRGFFQKQDPSPESIAEGVGVLCAEVRKRQPQARVVLMALFPRDGQQDRVDAVNARLAEIPGVTLLNINARLGPGSQSDGLHLSEVGYHVWTDELLRLID